jgi:hypothetical protein
MPTLYRLHTICLTVLCFVGTMAVARAQDAAAEAANVEIVLPEIPDEPQTVDPKTLVPEKLAAAVTVDFSESSLREVVAWLQDEAKVVVLIDGRALSGEAISPGEPVSDRLDDAPLYLLLNRLRTLGLDWYYEDDILHITTRAAAANRMSTEPYNIGDLLDAGYKPSDLHDAIMETTGGTWVEVDGVGGGIELLGDVMFVRQTDTMHREVQGLLSALRQHGRRTFTLDPPQHRRLREKLEENVSVNFADTPLQETAVELSRMAEIDIRLDGPALRKQRIREREPMTLRLSDRKLGTVLHVLLADLNLTWVLRDGVLWITSSEQADELEKTAVFDVRDLCRDEQESAALIRAILSQTKGPWMQEDGVGGAVVAPKTGVLVVRQRESGLQEVLDLLQTYRQALLASKPRDTDDVDPDEIITRYYRMHAAVADGLAQALPQLVPSQNWRTANRPEAAGSIVKVASAPELIAGKAIVLLAQGNDPEVQALVVSRAVLIIAQTRAVHDEIARVIRRVQEGDLIVDESDGAGGMGMGGMGGFGGGFFSVPRRVP